MRGIWLVINHNEPLAERRTKGFTQPRSAAAHARGLGWKDEPNGSFNQDPYKAHTTLEHKVHVTVQFVQVLE